MHACTPARTYARTQAHTHGTDRQLTRLTYIHACTPGRTHVRSYSHTHTHLYTYIRKNERAYGPTDGRSDGRPDGRTDYRQTDM